MFRDELLDLRELLAYVRLAHPPGEEHHDAPEHPQHPAHDPHGSGAGGGDYASSSASGSGDFGSVAAPGDEGVGATAALVLPPGGVATIFSEGDLESALAAAPGRVVVLFASLTWCRPCKRVDQPYKVGSGRPGEGSSRRGGGGWILRRGGTAGGGGLA